MTQTDSKVAAALELLRTGGAPSITAAARQVGAKRETVRDHWRRQIGTGPRFDNDRLDEDPATQLSEIPIFHLDYSDLGSLNMYPMGDVHVGAPQFAESTWDRWTDYLVDTPGTSVLFTGDGLNAALTTSVSDTYSEKLNVNDALKLLRAKLRPLVDNDQLDGMVRGNHEDRIWRAAGLDPLDQLADEFSIPYSPASMLLVYHVGDVEYEVFVRHGTGNGAATMGSQVNQLERAARIIQADVFLTGHTHTQAAFPKDLFRRGGSNPTRVAINPRAYRRPAERVERHKQLFVSSGSFLAYEEYAAQRGFPPAHIGAPRLYLDGRRKDAHASV